MVNLNKESSRREPSKSREIITDYKKAYEKLKAKVEVYEVRLLEQEQLIQEDEKRLLKLIEKQPTRRRVRASRTLKYGLGRSWPKQGDFQKAERQRNKEKILETLAGAHPSGKSNLMLAKSTGLSRWTVPKLCKELIKDGLVSKDVGKLGEYHLTQLSLGYPKLQAYWLEFNGYDSLISRYTSPTGSIKEKLRAFITTVGVYNTYVMLEAVLDQKFHTFVSTRIPGFPKKIDRLLGRHDGLDGDGLVKTRIEDAIRLTRTFLQLYRLVTNKEELDLHVSDISLNTPTETPSEPIPSKSLLEENKNMFDAYRKALADLYPEGTSELERIRKEEAPNKAWSRLKAIYKTQGNTASR